MDRFFYSNKAMMDHLHKGVSMAIAFARVTIHSRSKGHSAVAASAYRTGTRQIDERTGLVYDFSHRADVVFKETLLPLNSNSNYMNREYLWNQIELTEKRIDSQLCKDVVLALPKELELTHQIELTKRFANTHFIENGIPADIAIHDHGDGNPHAHILIPTRRLEKDSFSKYKARDLNPSFYSGKVIEDEYWGDKWRDFQNDFFHDKEIDMTVDLNHLITERHQGKQRNAKDNYIKQENELIRQQRIALLEPENLINHISLTHSVFTRRDIEKLIFKTLTQEQTSQFHSLVETVLQHKDVIHLGLNQEGRDAFTTRNQYIAESNLLTAVEQLLARKGHIGKQNTDNLVQQYQLNEEQTEAFSYVTKGSDISVLIGRPGVGKSYLLKPIKEHYETIGFRVIGASLSGKVAKALQNDTGINSFTLHSLNYRLQNNKLALTSKDIIVIDEAGMVDFANLASIIEAVNKAHAKIILVGDPDQLKPIHKGEIFKAIAAHTGYLELSNIRRQKDLGDRNASLMLARGEVEQAIEHYNQKEAIHFSETMAESLNQVVNDWQTNIDSKKSIQENLMFAFTRAAVTELNVAARQLLKNKDLLSQEEFTFYNSIQNSEPQDQQKIKLAQGDRVLLRKNDNTLGIRNGDMAFVEAIQFNELKVRLDSGQLVTIPHAYKHIDYGYATTVHKGQGMTVTNASVLIDSKYWDKHLSFVAMTRHREKLTIYADKHQHPDINSLTKTLSRAKSKDNVIDWPLSVAIRNGFDPDSIIGKVINHLAGIGSKIKEKFNYLVNYENNISIEPKESKQQIKGIAKQMADYQDAQAHYSLLRRNLVNNAKEQKVEIMNHKDFPVLYEQSIVRSRAAYTIWCKYDKQIAGIPDYQTHIKKIYKDAIQYEKYKIIADIASNNWNKKTVTEQRILLKKIDLKHDKIHIVQLAKQFKRNPRDLIQQIARTKEHFNALIRE